MDEPTLSEIQTTLDVLKYYEQKAEQKNERMLSALMSDSQSHVQSYAPIIIEDREKYETVMDIQ